MVAGFCALECVSPKPIATILAGKTTKVTVCVTAFIIGCPAADLELIGLDLVAFELAHRQRASTRI